MSAKITHFGLPCPILQIFLRFICVLIGSTRIFVSADYELGTVVLVNILFRHGDRTPVEPYPNDPYRNESLWPVPFGQLTNIGKHQQLRLGKWLQNRYANFLPKTYSPYDIYVKSTDVDRTLMSAEANLAGLYPPIDSEKWDIKSWMPIPVHTVPEIDDNVLAGKKYCDKYNVELERVKNSPELRKIDIKNQPLYEYLTKKSGKKVNSLETVEFLFNTLYIEKLYNRPLPEWTNSVFPEKMQPLAEMSFMLQAYNKRLQRLKSGPLLKEMIHHMHFKSKNALVPNRKIWMYSAHDDTIANFLMTLNLFEPHLPPYTATVLIELRMDENKDYFVMVFYKNSTEATLLTLPGCIPACPLQQFIKLTRDVIPENWEKECLIDFNNYEFNFNTAAVIAILSSSIMMLIILITILMGFVFCFLKRGTKYYLRLSVDG